MLRLCATPLDPTCRNHHQIPELDLHAVCPKSWIHSAQHNLQCPTPIHSHSHMGQALTEHAPHANTGDKARHYLPENELSPVSEADNGISTSSSTIELNPTLASLLPAIHWASKICKCDYSASKNEGNQSGKPLRGPNRDQPNTPPLPPSPLLSWNRDTKTLTHANPIIPDTHAHSATHSYTTLSLSPPVHQYVQYKYGPRGQGGEWPGEGGAWPPPNVHVLSEYQFKILELYSPTYTKV